MFFFNLFPIFVNNKKQLKKKSTYKRKYLDSFQINFTSERIQFKRNEVKT